MLNLTVSLDAVPHTVGDTHAEPVSRQSWRSSTGRLSIRGYRRRDSAVVCVRGLSRPGVDLQLLRPWPDLLRRGVRTACPPPYPASRRPALPDQPSGAAEACRAGAALPGAPQKRDASGFTPAAAP